jgi:hypothetical protein
MDELEERTRGFLRNADWLDTLEEIAQEGRALAVALDDAPEARLREVAGHVSRAAADVRLARAEIRLADRKLLGGE